MSDFPDNGSDKEMSRRDFLGWVAAITAMLALPGCVPGELASSYSRGLAKENPYNPPLKPASLSPAATHQAPEPTYVYVQPKSLYSPAPGSQSESRRRTTMARPQSGGGLTIKSRSAWANVAPNAGKMKPMNGVSRVTIHHEGSKPNNDTTPGQVTATLRLIQSQHKQRMGAGDIGYHFIIDRTGVVWQGRNWVYQGAHSSGANPHNLGIMLLGNFEVQKPTIAQLSSLNTLTTTLCVKYGLSAKRDLFGHSDLCNTKCPGVSLKNHVNLMRNALS